MKVEICVPALNEEKILRTNILKLYNHCLSRQYPFDWKITIANSGSTDGSREIMEELSSTYEQINFIDIKRRGKGLAVKTCWLNSDSQIFCYMDSDLSTSLEDLDNLLFPIISGEYDLVFGSRLLPKSTTEREVLRSISSLSWNIICRFILNHKFSDLQCGFKAARTDLLKKYSILILNDNWFFDTELVYSFHIFNNKIKEIPINWAEERYKKRKSKINLFKDPFDFLISMFKLKTRVKKIKKHGL